MKTPLMYKPHFLEIRDLIANALEHNYYKIMDTPDGRIAFMHHIFASRHLPIGSQIFREYVVAAGTYVGSDNLLPHAPKPPRADKLALHDFAGEKDLLKLLHQRIEANINTEEIDVDHEMSVIEEYLSQFSHKYPSWFYPLDIKMAIVWANTQFLNQHRHEDMYIHLQLCHINLPALHGSEIDVFDNDLSDVVENVTLNLASNYEDENTAITEYNYDVPTERFELTVNSLVVNNDKTIIEQIINNDYSGGPIDEQFKMLVRKCSHNIEIILTHYPILFPELLDKKNNASTIDTEGKILHCLVAVALDEFSDGLYEAYIYPHYVLLVDSGTIIYDKELVTVIPD